MAASSRTQKDETNHADKNPIMLENTMTQ